MNYKFKLSLLFMLLAGFSMNIPSGAQVDDYGIAGHPIEPEGYIEINGELVPYIIDENGKTILVDMSPAQKNTIGEGTNN